jgi:hypothetical protein
MNVRVNIERLVLDRVSLPPHQRAQFKLAVETELARLLERNVPRRLLAGGAAPHLSPGVVDLGQATTPQALGKRIGQSVYEGMER